MSDNQKPSRDTGEEVCECGHRKIEHADGNGSCLVTLGDCYCDSYKPAPKAPVSTEDCAKCGEFRLHPVHTYNRDPDYHAYEPKAPVREDKGNLWTAAREVVRLYNKAKAPEVTALTDEDQADWDEAMRELTAALKSKEKP